MTTHQEMDDAEYLVAYANSLDQGETGPTPVLNGEQAIIRIVRSHHRYRERDARQRRWFRAAPYWRRLLLTWSGFPW